MIKRVFLIVLDSFGIGELPDAADYGDKGSNTLRSVASSDKFNAKNLGRLGLFNIDGTCGEKPVAKPQAARARLAELSKGKDTTTGHWEIAGLVSEKPFPIFPEGFPADVIEKFTAATGKGVLCNKPYSGTTVINDYGDAHMKTGDLIVYTSADSVFQIAAHEDIVPPEKLYEYCEAARALLTGDYAVGRVIARPFTGSSGNYVRTSNRHDFSVTPTKKTMLDRISESGKDVIAVGKISDIFAGKGITESYPTKNNSDGMAVTSKIARKNFNGLCFVNLVDFDMLYGHRNDIDGYANAIAEFDRWLGGFIEELGRDDMLIITADHGCDPATESTDHSREYIPLLVYGEHIKPVNLNTLTGFGAVSELVLDSLDVENSEKAYNIYDKIFMKISATELINNALTARMAAYAPYSGFKVGAALLADDGTVFEGCNIENAAFSPTCCAERVAVFKGVSTGCKCFEAIAIAGGSSDKPNSFTLPCGVCRQVLSEFCDGDFTVICTDGDSYEKILLSELLPESFGVSDLNTEDK